MIAKHFKLKAEKPDHYVIHDTRDKRDFPVAKKGLSLAMHGELSKIQHFDEGGTAAGGDIPYDQLIPQEEAQNQPYGTANAQIPAQVSVNPPSSSSPESAPVTPDASAATPPAAQADPNAAIGMIGGNSPLEAEKAALQAGATAEGKFGTQSAQAWKDFTDNQASDNQDFMSRKAAYDANDAALQKAIAEKSIDPNRWWNNRSTGQKIEAGIGMIFGGMGAGKTDQPNAALAVINNAIQRDIDAQSNDQSKDMNLWKMNHEASQDATQAHLLTQNQALSAVKSKIEGFQAQASGPLAQARIAPVVSQINQQIQMNNFRRAALSTAASGAPIDADPAMFLNVVPQQDQAQAAKEIAAQQNWSQSRQHVLDTFQKIKQINTLGNRATSPIQTAAQVNALRDNAAVALARDEAGRVNEFEFKAGKDAFTGVGNSPETDQVKLQNLMSIMDQKKPPGTVFKSHTGIDLSRFRSMGAGAPTQAAPPVIKTMGGVPYQQVPGGWQRAG